MILQYKLLHLQNLIRFVFILSICFGEYLYCYCALGFIFLLFYAELTFVFNETFLFTSAYKELLVNKDCSPKRDTNVYISFTMV